MLKEIITKLTPENLSDNKFVSDSLDIFLEYLVENSDISIDIKNMFSVKHENVNNEFFKIYLNNIYKLFSESKTSNAVYEAFQNDPLLVLSNAEIPTLGDIKSVMDVEQYLTSKNYKEVKGTKLGFRYVYELVMNSGILGDVYKDSDSYFNYEETGNIFEYTVNGAISPELYTMLVEPITHPLGWNYVYTRLVSNVFQDYFKISFNYDFTDGFLQIRCQKPEGVIVSDYLSGNIYNIDDPDNPIGVVPVSGDVELIESIKLEKGVKSIIYFDSGEVLVSVTYPISNRLYSNTTDMYNNIPLIDYDINEDGTLNHCSLYSEFKTYVSTGIDDEIQFNSEVKFKEFFNHLYTTDVIIGEFDLIEGNIISDDNGNNLENENNRTISAEINSEDAKYPRVGYFIVGGKNIEDRLRDSVIYTIHYIADVHDPEQDRIEWFNKFINGVGYTNIDKILDDPNELLILQDDNALPTDFNYNEFAGDLETFFIETRSY